MSIFKRSLGQKSIFSGFPEEKILLKFNLEIYYSPGLSLAIT